MRELLSVWLSHVQCSAASLLSGQMLTLCQQRPALLYERCFWSLHVSRLPGWLHSSSQRRGLGSWIVTRYALPWPVFLV